MNDGHVIEPGGRQRQIECGRDVLRPSGNLAGGRRLDELFSETLACEEGDPVIGLSSP